MSNFTLATYPTLYSKDSMGRIRIWYMQQDLQNYRTVSGLQDGEKVTSEWTEAEAKNIGKKNEKKPIDQATEEVLSRYKKQKKTGYFESLQDVDNFQYVQCMLAKSYKDYADKLDFKKQPVLVQIKLNGQRCLATRHGLFTRKGERYTSIPHIEESLVEFFKVWPEAVLDGELYNYDLRKKLNELSSITRKTKNITEEDLKKSKDIIQYWCYDSYNLPSGEDASYTSRREEFMKSVALGWFNHPIIKVVESKIVNCQEKFEEFYNAQLEDGQEGIMIRFMESPYEHKRSKYLLKCKPEEDDTGKIVSLHYGTGNWSKYHKTATIEWNGVEFDATFKGSMEDLANLNPNDWIGRRVTFLYNGLTGKGAGKPNFARINILNCEPST